jgi:hypothetical protein
MFREHACTHTCMYAASTHTLKYNKHVPGINLDSLHQFQIGIFTKSLFWSILLHFYPWSSLEVVLVEKLKRPPSPLLYKAGFTRNLFNQ